MASIKISELNSLTQKDYNDVVPIVDTSANETKKISIENLVDNNVKLIAISDEAPSSATQGDKYYNTTSNKIFTYVGGDEWYDNGSPKSGIMYIVFGKQSTYAYDGTELVSVGGGSGAYIGTTEPPEDDNSNLWINPDEVVIRQENLIKTTYTESNVDGYSCNYINGVNTYTETSEIKTNKVYIDLNNKKWPIYRNYIKVLNPALSSSTYQASVAHGISNIKEVVNIYNWKIRTASTGNLYAFFPFVHQSGKSAAVMLVDDTNVTFRSGDTFTANQFYFEGYVEYTKTTD